MGHLLRERGRGRFWEELCSARYPPQPAAAAAAHKCPMLWRRAVWGTDVSWEEGKGGRDKTGGGSEPESRGGGSHL